MTKPGDKSTHMVLKLRTKDGKCERIKDEQGQDRTVLTPAQAQQIHDSPDTVHFGEILYRRESPG